MVLGAARLCFKWAYAPARLSAALGLALLVITSLWLALAQEKRRAACWQDSIPAFVGTLRPATLTHFALSRGRGSTLDNPPLCYSHCEQVFCTAGKVVADARIEDVDGYKRQGRVLPLCLSGRNSRQSSHAAFIFLQMQTHCSLMVRANRSYCQVNDHPHVRLIVLGTESRTRSHLVLVVLIHGWKATSHQCRCAHDGRAWSRWRAAVPKRSTRLNRERNRLELRGKFYFYVLSSLF
jgi:hypothetical protein